MSRTFICSHCGREHLISECCVFDSQNLCRNCYDTATCVCDHCGRHIWAEDSCGDENHSLCQTCRARYYTPCTDCGRLVERDNLHFLSEDSTDGYCAECYDRHLRENGIRNYSYKPEPIFYGTSSRYLGVELEIDCGGEDHENAIQLQRIGNEGHEHIYIKHDGSLDEGMEIVTHPMTLGYHQAGMPWKEVLRQAVSMGYRSHQAWTCGLHVHVNRSSLGATQQQKEDTIARILFLVETFWNELLRFSRRTQYQLDRWAARYGRKDDPKDVLRSAKSHADRYTCVNLTPDNTIEFRIFRGTLKYNTLIATLQLVEAICDVAFALSDDEVKAITWSGFVSNLYEDTMPELIQYLKERRLYVNEIIVAEEEV